MIARSGNTPLARPTLGRRYAGLIAGLATLALLGGGTVLAQGGGLTLPWSRVANGGATALSSGSLTLSGTFGQAEAGRVTSGNLTLTGGFWGETAPAQPPPHTRPNVGVVVAPVAAGRLRATIAARDAACTHNNQLVSIHVTRTDNATVDVGTRTGASGDFVESFPAGPPETAVFVNRVTPGRASTVQLIVTDGCGDWPTFVGGGPNAF